MAVWAEFEEDDEPSDCHSRQMIEDPILLNGVDVSDKSLGVDDRPAEYIAHALRCYPYALCRMPKC